jgi:hypothetical protein
VCDDGGGGSSLVVLELSATIREAKPLLAKDGRMADEGVCSPRHSRMEARQARALTPHGAQQARASAAL